MWNPPITLTEIPVMPGIAGFWALTIGSLASITFIVVKMLDTDSAGEKPITKKN